MAEFTHKCEVLVVGAGPAGMAAACRAAEDSSSVTVVDDNTSPGGQIWRQQHAHPDSSVASAWFEKIRASKLEFINNARVFQAPNRDTLLAETDDGVVELKYSTLVLATGARERFLPFPGWTLPNVVGAGGLQALVKSGFSVAGKRIVIAGSGPLLLAVASYLRQHGAEIVLIAEQAQAAKLVKFGLGLFGLQRKRSQALKLRKELKGLKYSTSCWPVAAQGTDKLTSVTLRQGGRLETISCDLLAYGYHLIPNLELPILIGCVLRNNFVQVNEYQESSIPNTYCAGEVTGIGGLELSLVEGEIAGLAATGRRDEARDLFAFRSSQRKFASLLNQTFALRDELKNLPGPDTLVCRCEDVPYGTVCQYSSWREAKLQTRCGMGPCQGRICGGALQFLVDWEVDSVRPPVLPVRVESLIM
jgi:NADPH-dependent 2,4-dienoyl-CoA reductase/sulfur reductase-like enzyme